MILNGTINILDNDLIVSINLLISSSLFTSKLCDSDEYAIKITANVTPNDANGQPYCDIVFNINAICWLNLNIPKNSKIVKDNINPKNAVVIFSDKAIREKLTIIQDFFGSLAICIWFVTV